MIITRAGSSSGACGLRVGAATGFLVLLAGLASAQTPLTPIIGITPESVDFGDVAVGTCRVVTADLFNASPDPASLLEVTSISIAGGAFTIEAGPAVPLTIPGDGSRVTVLLRVCTSVPGTASGRFAVAARRAANTPHDVPLASQGIDARFASRRFHLAFAPGAVTPPTPPGGPLGSFGFNVEGLRTALEQAGVERLEKLLPNFTPESVHTTNALGEEVLLTDMSGHYIALLLEGRGVVEAIDLLRDRTGIVSVEPDFAGTLHSTFPNDALFNWDVDLERGGQWGLHNVSQFPFWATDGTMVYDVDMNIPEAWDIHTGSATVEVAVIDTGVDLDHVDLAPRVVGGYNFLEPGNPPDDPDPGSHGTAVAGIIGATGNNVQGLAGTSWAPTIVPLRAANSLDPNEVFFTQLAQAIDWARENGTPIANISYGASRFSTDISYAAGNAARAGTFLVASMGNQNAAAQQYPAAHDWSVFGVGALWFNNRRWQDSEIPGLETSPEGSNYGSWIDVCAPGGASIVTAKTGNAYYDNDSSHLPVGLWNGFRGSSASAAFASGVAALLKSYHTDLIGEDFAEIMQRTARDIELYGIGQDDHTGFGLIRADAAIAFVRPPQRRLEHHQIANLTIHDVVTGQHTFIDVPGLPSGTYAGVSRYELWGTVYFETAYLSSPSSWPRTSGTIGWTAANPTYYPSDPLAWAELVDGTQATHHTFRTFVYEVPGYGWFPAYYSAARIAMTAVGDQSVIGVAGAAPAGLVRIRVAPNPGQGHLHFLLNTPRHGAAALRIYDPTGRLVRTIIDGTLTVGSHTLGWDGRNESGRDVASGLYFYRLDFNGERIADAKIQLIR